MLGRVNTPLALLAADAVLTRPPRARTQAFSGAVGRSVIDARKRSGLDSGTAALNALTVGSLVR